MVLKPLNKLLETEMDRKEFLIYTGLILLTLTGISNILKNISSITQGKQKNGFGAGPYGK